MAISRSGACALVALFLAAAPAVAAQTAPPQYQSSEPGRDATVHKAPDQVEVTFDQPLDDTSALAVTDECDRQLDDGSTEVSGSTMSIGIVERPAGEYNVEYTARGLANITGTNNGHFTFTVHAGQGCEGGSGHDHHEKDDERDHDGKHDDNEHGEHDDEMTHGSGDHMTEHGTTHAAGTMTHSDGHGTGGTHGDAGHDGGNGHNDNHSNGTGSEASGSDVPGITSSDTARKLFARADSNALLAALGLCLILGILGGTVLRASAARR